MVLFQCVHLHVGVRDGGGGGGAVMERERKGDWGQRECSIYSFLPGFVLHCLL